MASRSKKSISTSSTSVSVSTNSSSSTTGSGTHRDPSPVTRAATPSSTTNAHHPTTNNNTISEKHTEKVVTTPSGGKISTSVTTVHYRSSTEELAAIVEGLNDRLSAYIEKVRSLESEIQELETDKDALTIQLKVQKEAFEESIEHLRSQHAKQRQLYEDELKETRRLLDETAREKARIQIQLNKYKAESEEWRSKYFSLEREFQTLQARYLTLEAQIAELKAKLGEFNRLKLDYETLEKQLGGNKKQLEDEMVMRVDFENRLQTAREELAFKEQMHEQEVSQMRKEIQITIEKQITDMRSVHDPAERSRMAAQVSTLEMRISDMEDQMRQDRDIAARMLAERDAELMRLRVELQMKTDETDGLIKKRVLEYRKLLDAEETRFSVFDRSPGTGGTPRNPLRSSIAGQKRKLDITITSRDEVDIGKKSSTMASSTDLIKKSSAVPPPTPEMSKLASSTHAASVDMSTVKKKAASKSSGKGVISVLETNKDGKFVKIQNMSKTEVSIADWILKHRAGESESFYKFPKGTSLKAGMICTVYSSDSGATHQPPTELVMTKGQRWFSADEMTTTLVDNKSEEQAGLEMWTTIDTRVLETRQQTYISTTATVQSEKVQIAQPAK